MTRVTPVRFTTDVAAMRRFCVALGLEAELSSESGDWVSLRGTGGGVGLHSVATAETPRAPGGSELSFEADEPLEALQARLEQAGFESTIVDESFGRSLRTIDPDGVEVQVFEPQTDLYGYRAEQADER